MIGLVAPAVAAAVLGVYVTSLGGPFLWDDRFLVLDERLASLGVLDAFRLPFWNGAQAASTSYYRPLVTLSFALDARIHGGNASGYHLTNVAFHVVNALLLLALVRRTGVRPVTAGLAVTGWALLPRLAEAVAWISGRTDLVATTFVLGALLCWGGSRPRRVGAALLVGLGLFAKESAIAAVLGISVAEWVALARAPGRGALSEWLSRVVWLGLAVLAYVVLRLVLVGAPTAASSLGFLGRAAAVLESAGTYAAMLLDAWRPRAVIGRLGASSVSGVAAGLVVLVGIVIVLVRYRQRITPKVALGLGLAAGALLPVLHLFPIPLRTLAADRFLYLPAAGLVLALAPAVDGALAHRRPAWLAALALVASLGYVTLLRVRVWSDELEFWVETLVQTPPTNNTPVVELLGVYDRAGLHEDALALAQLGLTYDDPNRNDLLYDSAIALMRLGRLDEARARLLANRWRRRVEPDIELLLAGIELRSGELDAARRRLLALARSGNAEARQSLSHWDELLEARAELAAPGTEPRRRAILAMRLGDAGLATLAWSDVLARPESSERAARDALLFLARNGARDSLRRGRERYLARFGRMDSELAALIEARLHELDRLLAARNRIYAPASRATP